MRFSRLLYGLLAAVCAGSILAGAQSITKSVQLSQDPSGPIGFDTSNNTYFPGHINGSGSTPQFDAGSCGVTQNISGVSTSRSIAGTDNAGTIQTGGTATQCQVSFRTAFNSTPACVFSSNTAASQIGWTVSTAGFNISMASAAGLRVNYNCAGAPN